jgi:hypothetical protein
MSGDVCPVDRQKAKGSDRVSNGTAYVLFGDGRSPGARRYRSLLQSFATEAGGMDALPASAQQVVRRLAQTSVELELMEAERAAGNTIDAVCFVRLVGTQRRLLKDLALLKPKSTRESTAAARAAFLEQRFGPPQPVSDAA